MSTVAKQLEGGSDRASVSRRDFLRVGGLGVVGLSVAEQRALARSRASAGPRSCILLLMTGGPSQLETFDPKPDAPRHVRGPLKAISTSIPGIAFSEGLPQLAQRADRLSVLRSLTHDFAPIHETGLQLLQTGRLAHDQLRPPSFGTVVAHQLGNRKNVPAATILPRPICDEALTAHCGQDSGFLSDECRPTALPDAVAVGGEFEAGALQELLSVSREPEAVRRDYGNSRFGRLCLQSRRLVAAGVRCVTLNLFDHLEGEVTWDCHAQQPGSPATLFDYRDMLCPQFDKAFSALLDDLDQRGLLEDTLVIAAGEFGRTPYVNEHGGRDHWPDVFSAVIAGGGTRAGQVIGASDAEGAAVADRPINPAELTASIYHFLGLDLAAEIPGQNGASLPIIDEAPITELFA